MRLFYMHRRQERESRRFYWAPRQHVPSNDGEVNFIAIVESGFFTRLFLPTCLPALITLQHKEAPIAPCPAKHFAMHEENGLYRTTTYRCQLDAMQMMLAFLKDASQIKLITAAAQHI